MAQKTHKHTSTSGKDYEIRGSQHSGYTATDKTTGKTSVYATDSIGEMQSHIEKVERGSVTDANGFGKKIDQIK